MARTQATVSNLDPEALAAMTAAAMGDTRKLERMLASPRADLARAAVQQWVLTHPEPKPNLDSPTAKQTMLAAAGSYDYYCTGYNGSTIGWNGKKFRACHGYLNSYISGSHVGRYLPDVYPTGAKISAACKKAYAGATITLMGALTAGVPTGGWGWVAGTAAVGWAVQDVWFSCGRRY